MVAGCGSCVFEEGRFEALEHSVVASYEAVVGKLNSRSRLVMASINLRLLMCGCKHGFLFWDIEEWEESQDG